MKQLIFSIFIIFVWFPAMAQIDGNESDMKIYKDSVVVFNNPILNSSKYKFLFENEKGQVFESQVDKMRCLVPKFPSNMPVKGTYKMKPEQMPNASRPDSIPSAPNKK